MSAPFERVHLTRPPDRVAIHVATGASRTLVRLAAALWLLFGLVVWNVVFDYEVRIASDDYLARQGLHDAGVGPHVSIDSVMAPAKARGVIRASLWGGAIALAGLSLTAVASRKS
jgi:hypothetical protein